MPLLDALARRLHALALCSCIVAERFGDQLLGGDLLGKSYPIRSRSAGTGDFFLGPDRWMVIDVIRATADRDKSCRLL